MKTKDINIILFDSCVRGDIEGAELAIKGGADIEYADKRFPYTVIDTAVYHSHKNIVELLISTDVSISEISFLFAIESRDFKMIDLLMGGDLSAVSWSAVFESLSRLLENDENYETFIDVLNQIEDHLGALLRVSYNLTKEMRELQ